MPQNFPIFAATYQKPCGRVTEGVVGTLPYQKDGVLVRNFETNSLGGTMILFCGCGLKFFLPRRFQYLPNTLSPVIFVQFNTLKDAEN